MESLELERTFLLKRLPEGLERCKRVEITDLYIPASVEHPTMRVRKYGERKELTKKQPAKDGDTSQQVEHTIPLSEAEFNALAKLESKKVEKTRFLYPMMGLLAEIGVFHGPLEGLALMDVEFRSAKEMAAFAPPDFCSADVTQEKPLAGGMLAGRRYAEIEPVLAKFGYRKIRLPVGVIAKTCG